MKQFHTIIVLAATTALFGYGMDTKKESFQIPAMLEFQVTDDTEQRTGCALPGDIWLRIISACSSRNATMHVCKYLWQFATRQNEEKLLIDPDFTSISMEDTKRLLCRFIERGISKKVTDICIYIKQKLGTNPAKLTWMGIPVHAYTTNPEIISILQQYHKRTLLQNLAIPLKNSFIYAAHTGNEENVKKELELLLQERNNDSNEQKGIDALIYLAAWHAAILDHVPCLKLLLPHVNIVDKKDILAQAIDYGNFSCVELLLQDKDIDPNTQYEENNHTTPLLYAASKGKTNIVTLLLASGANQVTTDIIGVYPLYRAYEYNRGHVIQVLLEDLKKRPTGISNLITAAKLYGACVLGDIEYVRSAYKTDTTCNTSLFPMDQTLLHVAAKSHQPALVSFLISNGHAIDPVDKRGRTPLMHAVGSEDLPIVQILHKAGANMQAKEPTNHTSLLMGAVANNNLPITQYLIQHGANLKEKDFKGMTLLHNAAIIKKSAPIIEYLVKQGMVIDEELPEEAAHATALRVACVHESFSAAKQLITLGANITIHNHAAIRSACSRNHVKIIQLLIDTYEKSGFSLRHMHHLSDDLMDLALKKGYLDTVKVLLDAGVRITEAMIERAQNTELTEIEQLLRKTQEERLKTS